MNHSLNFRSLSAPEQIMLAPKYELYQFKLRAIPFHEMMAPADGGFRAPSHVVIRDIYEDERSDERFEDQLDDALRHKKRIILIEPIKLGSDTRNHIIIGNRFHKTAVLAGLSSLLASGLAHMRVPEEIPYHHLEKVSLPLAVLGWICTAVYDISWQCDTLSKYQVLTDNNKISIHAIKDLHSTTALVLERKDDTVRKYLHNTISLATLAYFSWRLYNHLK